ncbi:MAG TPA: histidine phosphatase family protein [Patescibacteria group bacterium]|nr:histidine phosphatase family protein [Patescibacteria group bacterium]
MPKLILLRHLESQWNEENRFNGWIDTPLLEGYAEKAENLAQELSQFKIDEIFCSCLFRNMDTVAKILEYDKKYPLFIHLDPGKMKKRGHFKDLSEYDIPVYVSEDLNERYYGELQGSNKEETIKKYGEEKVRLWRRSWNQAPPKGESLKDVFNRVVPFYRKYIEKDLKKGKNVLIVASHNALRALVKYLEKISDEEVINLEITTGGLREYDF